MSAISDRAEEVRRQSFERLLNSPGIRLKTQDNLRKIDGACRAVVEKRGDLSVAGVVRTLRTMHPSLRLAEQTFYNKTEAGGLYREVIAIWRAYEVALDEARNRRQPQRVEDDLPDMLLERIQPEGARAIVLAMRTSLRNLRKQITIMRSLTPDQMIRYTAHPVLTSKQSMPVEILSLEERGILAAFLDPTEMASRNGQWDDLGRLVSSDSEALSRPGLFYVLEKVLAAATPVSGKPKTGKE